MASAGAAAVDVGTAAPGAAPGPGVVAVHCEGLTRRHGSRDALLDLSLEVRPGEVFGLVGANGGGKTTAMRLMAGLLAPDEGTCRIFGQAPGQVRARIGYMAQDLALYGHLTVAENLQVRASLFGLPRAGRVADAAMERFALHPYAHSRVATLSGGWARRAQFAASLIHRPDLLLLDEPTVGLDAAARQELWRHVLLLAAGGVAVVVSTHDLAEAERFSRLVFLRDGRVLAAGTVDQVVERSGARALLLTGPGAPSAATRAMQAREVVAAYPSAGALRLITRQDGEWQAHALAQRCGLEALAVAPSLDDAAQVLLRSAEAPS